jgi:hypothetical protein
MIAKTYLQGAPSYREDSTPLTKAPRPGRTQDGPGTSAHGRSADAATAPPQAERVAPDAKQAKDRARWRKAQRKRRQRVKDDALDIPLSGSDRYLLVRRGVLEEEDLHDADAVLIALRRLIVK